MLSAVSFAILQKLSYDIEKAPFLRSLDLTALLSSLLFNDSTHARVVASHLKLSGKMVYYSYYGISDPSGHEATSLLLDLSSLLLANYEMVRKKID